MALRIGAIKVLINECIDGVYLRWWFNGWHYFLFTNGYEMTLQTESMGTQVTRFFSIISKVERPTRIKSQYSYRISVEGITPGNIGGFNGLLIAEKVEQWYSSEAYDYTVDVPVTADSTILTADNTDLTADVTSETGTKTFMSGSWHEVEVTRGSHLIREAGSPGYKLEFEVTREELPYSSSVYHKNQRLYLDDDLCELDDDEVIAITKQVNDIAEMKDRQSDYSASFKIEKTRAMKALFELSGETGINTIFPYEEKTCKLIADNIEIVTGGRLILDRVDDYYYYVSILTGNKNFFTEIENKKLSDLALAGTNHTWNRATMAATHASDLDYVYPLCEPSDDGGISPLTDDGTDITFWGGLVWCFVKAKAIFDEIFSDAGFTAAGEILTNDVFSKMFLPISTRKVNKDFISKYLYSIFWTGMRMAALNDQLGDGDFPNTILVNGDANMKLGYYYAPWDATYKILVTVIPTGAAPTLSVYLNSGYQGDMTVTSTNPTATNYEYEVAATAGQHFEVLTSAAGYMFFSLIIIDIVNPLIAFGSVIEPRYYLPAITQKEFIKMICQLFGLIPETNPRTRIVTFWTYNDLYNNIPRARNWSAYLSERDDDIEFKFGNYGQSNYLRYKQSDDVSEDQGMGVILVEDTTLPDEKEMVELNVSSADEVTVMDTNFDVDIARIAFNKFKETEAIAEDSYEAESEIDPRLVYVEATREIVAPPYEKTFGIRETTNPAGAVTTVNSPKKASTLEVSFSRMVTQYAGLSRLLTKANLRRAKMNLPAYEVAGLQHVIPIYLSQYKAYFYVNKIVNYVPGQLTTVELIKL